MVRRHQRLPEGLTISHDLQRRSHKSVDTSSGTDLAIWKLVLVSGKIKRKTSEDCHSESPKSYIHTLVAITFFQTMQVKGNAVAKSTSAVVLWILVCVSIYTHIIQPYHPWPFNNLKTSKCINPEHKKGVSHKTKKPATLPPSCCSWKSRKMAPSHCTAWEREISKTSGPKRWTTLWSTKTSANLWIFKSYTWMLQKSRKNHHLLPCYLWNPYEKWDTLQMNLCRISSINSCFWNNQAKKLILLRFCLAGFFPEALSFD